MIGNKAKFEHARQQAINILRNMDCEDVVRSVLFVLGDYEVAKSESKEKAKKRASYITGILCCAASTETMEALQYVYEFARGAARAYEAKEAKCEKGGEA